MPKGYPSLTPTRVPGRAKRVFLKTNGPAPWPCGSCSELVHQLGHGGENGLIHHDDEDPTNDVPDNLMVMHDTCHVRHHRAGKIGNRKGSTVSAETRLRLSDAHRGRPAAHGYTAEVRKKISDAQRGKPHVERQLICECGKTCHAGPMARHLRAQNHALMERVNND